VGNVYLGKVQNVLPSMEAAFVDIGKGRNAVLYAGEVNFDASGLEGQPKRIESALKPGQSVIVQVTKDPVGHKGARLTSQVSLPGRYLVYVPGASMTGISRKLPDTERNRLKHILKKVTPENAGVIVRTAAEGAAEAELDRDVTRLAAQWENIEKKAKTATAPALLYGEPDLTIRVIRDVFNEDFSKLIVSGDDGWDIIDEYVRYVAPHLADRLDRWDDAPDGDDDVFTAYRIDEQLAKALERKVWLPSGGSLVIDRTEAMTVVDVNTGKFTGQGGNLEETVTRNNLEAAEEIVRQLRLRDVGGIVVIDFIDMVLESNRELVLRRLLECLARDRTKHQVAEVTSLGLVQMTRKRVGAGLLEAFSQPCECCNGRGVIVTLDQQEPSHRSSAGHTRRPGPAGNGGGSPQPVRPGQDRSWQERNGPDTAARDEEAPTARRGRRDGRTNGGTASASAVEVVEAAPAAPVAVVVDDVPRVALPVPADAPAADPAVPVRRTRAGSAMARVSVTTEEPPPIVTATVPPAAPASVTDEAAPVADAELAAETAAVDEAPAEEAASVPDVAPVELAPFGDEVTPAADVAQVEDVAPVEDAAPVEDTAPVEDPAPVEDTAPLDDAAPVGDVAPAEYTAPAEDAAPVGDVAPAEDAAPVEDVAQAETVPPAAELAPVAEVAPDTDVAPASDATASDSATFAEFAAPVDDAAPAADLAPAEVSDATADTVLFADASPVADAAPVTESASVAHEAPVADEAPAASDSFEGQQAPGVESAPWSELGTPVEAEASPEVLAPEPHAAAASDSDQPEAWK
jgi:ribonuclease E